MLQFNVSTLFKSLKCSHCQKCLNSIKPLFECSHQLGNNIICNIWVLKAQVSINSLQLLLHCVHFIVKLLHANCCFTSFQCYCSHYATFTSKRHQNYSCQSQNKALHLYILHLPFLNLKEWMHHHTTTNCQQCNTKWKIWRSHWCDD